MCKQLAGFFLGVWILLGQPAAEPGFRWFNEGLKQHAAGSYAEAIESFQKAIVAEHQVPAARYRIARAFAKKGEPKKAMEWLWAAAKSEFANVTVFRADADLASLKELEEFQQIDKLIALNSGPCANRPIRKQFLFWVGEWEAMSGSQKVGQSVIQLHENGCSILENWKDAQGNVGKSLNFYNPHTGRWNQEWAGANGRLSHFVGDFVDGAMVFVTDGYAGPTRTMTKMTFTAGKDGTFRQVGETSTDGGATYKPGWDFTYRRRQAANSQ